MLLYITVSTIQLRVNHVTEEMLSNAVTLRVRNISAEAFLVPFYNYLIEGLSVVIPTPKSNIHVFSVRPDTEAQEQILNITFRYSACVHKIFPV